MHRYGYRIRGFGRLSNYGLCFMVMVSEKAQYRYEVLCFWDERRTGSNTRVLQGKAAHAFHLAPSQNERWGSKWADCQGGSKRLYEIGRIETLFLYQIRIFTNEYRTSSNLEQRGLVLRCRMKEPKLCERTGYLMCATIIPIETVL